MQTSRNWHWIPALLIAVLTGCGEWGGGATYVPAVTVLPAELDGDAGEAVVADAGGEAAAEPAGDSSGFGTVSGRVVLTGSAPTLDFLIAQGADVKDKEVCAAVDMPDERLVLGSANGVANAFVYLSKPPRGGKELAPAGEPLIFDQKNCRFIPHCMIVPTGATVKVLSDDAVAHNTHTYPRKNQGVNSGVAPNDREGKLEIVYRRPESTPVPVKCDYHAWMSAYHLPIDHPYAAVTDESGNFTIPELPAGEHSFSVWHEAADGGFVERRLNVTVTAGTTTEVQVDFPADTLTL